MLNQTWMPVCSGMTMTSTGLLICDKQSAPRLLHRDVSATMIYSPVLNRSH